jgi:hypothetical protein
MRKKALEPVTFVRSPTFTKLLCGVTISGSRPDNFKVAFVSIDMVIRAFLVWIFSIRRV